MASLARHPATPARDGWLIDSPVLCRLGALWRAGRVSEPLRRWYVATRVRRALLAPAVALAADGWSAPPRTVTLAPAPAGGEAGSCRVGLPLAAAYRLADALAPSHSLLAIAGGDPLAWGGSLFPFLSYCRGRDVATSLALDGTGLARDIAALHVAPPDLLAIALPEEETDASLEAREALLHLLALKGGDRWQAPLVVVELPSGSRLRELLRHAEAVGAVAARVIVDGGVSERRRAALAGAACGLPVLLRRPPAPCGPCRGTCAYLHARVDPAGIVRACGEAAVGSLLEQEFPAIWNGHPLRQLRRDRRAGPAPACAGWCGELV